MLRDWSIRFRENIEALRAQAEVRDRDGALLESFAVFQEGHDWVVRNTREDVLSRHERWDIAAERALEAATAYITRAMRHGGTAPVTGR